MLRVVPIDGVPGATARYTSTNAAQSLPAAVITVAGKTALGIEVSVETQSVRVGFGGAVLTQGASGLGHLLTVGTIKRYYGSQVMSTFQYISAVINVHGDLVITPFYTP